MKRSHKMRCSLEFKRKAIARLTNHAMESIRPGSFPLAALRETCAVSGAKLCEHFALIPHQ
jgi:hypothetical protein